MEAGLRLLGAVATADSLLKKELFSLLVSVALVLFPAFSAVLSDCSLSFSRGRFRDGRSGSVAGVGEDGTVGFREDDDAVPLAALGVKNAVKDFCFFSGAFDTGAMMKLTAAEKSRLGVAKYRSHLQSTDCYNMIKCQGSVDLSTRARELDALRGPIFYLVRKCRRQGSSYLITRHYESTLVHTLVCNCLQMLADSNYLEYSQSCPLLFRKNNYLEVARSRHRI